MSHLKPNAFSSYEMTDKEELQSAILTINQKEHIQNELALAASSVLQLSCNGITPEEYLRDVSYDRGRIAAFQWLLTQSTIAEDVLKNNPVT